MGQALVGAWRQQCLDREQWRWCQDGKDDLILSKDLTLYDQENLTKLWKKISPRWWPVQFSRVWEPLDNVAPPSEGS